MNEHHPESQAKPADPVEGAAPAAGQASRGERLRAAREAAGLSQADIAARLRLSLRQVQALETDEETALPPAPFVRGFVRNFARAVGRDPIEFDPPPPERGAEAGPESLPPLVLPAPERAIRLESGRASANRRWLGAALAALLLGVLGSWVRLEHLDAAGFLLSQKAPSALGSLGSSTDAPASVHDAKSDGAAVAEGAAEGNPAGAQAPAAQTAAVANPPLPVAPQPGAPGAGSATVDAVSATGTRTLALDFDADCWVEVRDENNQVLLSGVSRAGDHRDVEAHGPLRIVVGNAPATRLSWNGRPVDLAEFTRVTVARLTLDPSVEHP